MSHLDVIRAALARGYTYNAEQAEDHVRDLLAVVDAVKKHWTPAVKADSARTTASHMTGQQREEWLEVAAAWDGLTCPAGLRYAWPR